MMRKDHRVEKMETKELLTTEEAQKHIQYAIDNSESSGTFILNDNAGPYETRIHIVRCGNSPPKYNIDWECENTSSGFTPGKNGHDAMGSLDFDTFEEGAEKLARQVNGSVPSYAWMSDEEKEKLDKEIQAEFKDFFDKHCDLEKGDCPDRSSCPVRWPGGFGLQGCTNPIKSERGGYSKND